MSPLPKRVSDTRNSWLKGSLPETTSSTTFDNISGCVGRRRNPACVPVANQGRHLLGSAELPLGNTYR